MITFHAGKLATIGVLLCLTTACSREQQDWRSAEGADTMEAYGQFLERHPDSELATQARARVAQLSEDLDWQRAGSAETAAAYRQFLAQHPNGKWAQEARIRIENFALGGPPSGESAATGPSMSSPAPAARSPEAAVAESAVSSAKASTTPVEQSQSPPPASSALPASSFGVQLGAFSSEGGATKEWEKLTTRFHSELQGLSPHIVSANTASGHLYRLQADVADEARARAICDSLKRNLQSCVPVLPR